MTSASREAEADRVEAAYRWALTQIGIGVIQDQLSLWDDSAAASSRAALNAWLAQAEALVKLRGAWLKRLAITYYRLTRALRTGKTINVPGYAAAGVSIESLRREFEQVLAEVEYHGGSTLGPILKSLDRDMPDLPRGDTSPIPVEDLPLDWDTTFQNLEDSAEHQVEVILQSVGPDAFNNRHGDHDRSGADVASQAERISLMYARGMTADLSQVDEEVLGWARLSTTGTPCAFCAMLISRGFDYKSYEAAGGNGSSEVREKFHPNCHCVAVPVFSDAQYENSPLFALNRKYFDLWDEVQASDTPGKDALNKWRNYLRHHGMLKNYAKHAA